MTFAPVQNQRIGTRHTWRGFLRSNKHDPDCKTLLRINGASPSQMQTNLTGMFKEGRIDEETYEYRAETCRKWQAKYNAAESVMDVRDPADWNPCGSGRVRVNHLEADMRTTGVTEDVEL